LQDESYWICLDIKEPVENAGRTNMYETTLAKKAPGNEFVDRSAD
jgi:hypothetical protein